MGKKHLAWNKPSAGVNQAREYRPEELLHGSLRIFERGLFSWSQVKAMLLAINNFIMTQ